MWRWRWRYRVPTTRAQCSEEREDRHSKLCWSLCVRTGSGAKTKKLLLSPHFPRFPRLPENPGLRFSAAELNSDAGLLVEAISSWRRAKQSIDICSVSYIKQKNKVSFCQCPSLDIGTLHRYAHMNGVWLVSLTMKLINHCFNTLFCCSYLLVTHLNNSSDTHG